MITIERDRLSFNFPKVYRRAHCRIEFQRTLRIPDDDRTYPLPPGLGPFPLRHLDDFADRLSQENVRRGGVVMPIHQAEALWINFPTNFGLRYPCAVKVATGKVCAVSGEPWEEGLTRDPQNYVVVPGQPWLDGYCVAKGTIRQFVAMPLGGGYTTEEQLTGEGVHGGLQIAVYPMKREVHEALGLVEPGMVCREGAVAYSPGMGLAPGGRMTQEIYEDEFGVDAWDQELGDRCFVTLANSVQWMAITGERPPTEPPTAREYTEAGLPWFSYYDADREALEGAERLAGLRSVGQMAEETGDSTLSGRESSDPQVVIGVGSDDGDDGKGRAG